MIGIGHAKLRALVVLPDGRQARLLCVYPNARRAKVHVGGRHHTVPLDDLTLVGFLDDQLRAEGWCDHGIDWLHALPLDEDTRAAVAALVRTSVVAWHQTESQSGCKSGISTTESVSVP